MYVKNCRMLYVSLFLNFVNCDKYSKIFAIDKVDDNSSENCIVKIIKNNIRCGNFITVVSEKNVDSLLEAISNDDCYSLTTRTFHSREWLIRNEYVIVLAKDIFDFESGINNFTNGLMWNTNAKYIIEIPNIRRGKEIAKILLKHNIYRAVFINDSQESEKRIYTYHPFKFGNCVGDQDTVLSLGFCEDNVSVLNITFPDTYFPNTFPDKFNKCIIRVARYDDIPNVLLESSNYTFRGERLPGLEEYIIETIGANKGYVVDYIKVGNKGKEHGVVLANGTVTGVLKYLAADKADIAIGGFILISNRAKAFDYIWGYQYEGFKIFTAVKPVNDWKLVYKEFGWLTWILIGAFYCLFITVLNIYNITATFMTDRVLLMLRLWGYLYENTSDSLCKKKKIRGIVGYWIWFTFFISNFYNTAFYSLTTIHNSNIHHGVSEKFDESVYKPCISDNIRTLFKYTFGITWPKNTLTICNKKTSVLETVASRNNLFTIELTHEYTMKEQKYINEKGTRMLDTWEFSKVNTVKVMFTTKGFPLKNTIEAATKYMLETGLIEAHQQLIYLKTLKAIHTKQKEYENLDMSSIRIVFALLFCGLLIALIVFILEVVFNKSDLILNAIALVVRRERNKKY